MIDPADIDNVDEFLALAWLLEEEGVVRYQELTDAMESQNDAKLAELFRAMGEHGRDHASDIKGYIQGAGLPALSVWEYDMDGAGPETVPDAAINYQMSIKDALNIGLHHEQRAHLFYDRIAKNSPNQEIRVLATTFAEEEAEHAAMLETQLDKLPEESS